jgi:hypothetical protein
LCIPKSKSYLRIIFRTLKPFFPEFFPRNIFLRVTDITKWTQDHVKQWLLWDQREFCLEVFLVDNLAVLDGEQLCRLSRDDFLNRAPFFIGNILWEHLEFMKKGG